MGALAKIVVCTFAILALNHVQSQSARSSINKFTYPFYKATGKIIPGKSLIMSPLSANIILALLSLGAEGDTRDELNTALYIPDEDYTRSAYEGTISYLTSQDDVNLILANKIYLAAMFQLNPNFENDAVSLFYSEVESIDFADNVNAAQNINGWVENKTNNTIKDLLSPDALSALTRMVLVNTVYFKADWSKKFKTSGTKKRDFFKTPTDKILVDMMSQTGNFSYGSIPSLDSMAVELFYVGEQFSMVIILPNKNDGLKTVEKKLSWKTKIGKLLKGLKDTRMLVSIPKFKIETSMDLKLILPKVGINLIFDKDNAQLGLLLDNNNEQLYASEAVQKAFIEVNEEGTIASAATAIVITARTSSLPPKIQFVANRPFLFLIKSCDGTILFIGKYIGN